jgi:hypothetical protein
MKLPPDRKGDRDEEEAAVMVPLRKRIFVFSFGFLVGSP